MKSSRKTKLLIAASVAVLLQATAAADQPLPAKPELGPAIKKDLPPLGDTSGIGKASGGVSPDKIEKVVRAARTDRQDTFRGSKKSNPLDRLGRSVVLVVTPTQLGSATLIDRNGTFVTAWHIVKDEDRVGIIFMPSNKSQRPTEADAVQATVMRANRTTDLALIQSGAVDKHIRPILMATPATPEAGTRLRILGHPYGEIWSHTEGMLTETSPAFKWQASDGIMHQADVVKFQTSAITGNAGGPILNRQDRLLAVDTLRMDERSLTSLAVSVTEVKRILNSPQPQAIRAAVPKAPAKACEPVRLDTRRTKANDATVHILDLNCNGRTDAMMLVPDSSKSPNYLSNDANENGVTDSVYFDFNRDGKFDEVQFDTNEDGMPDLVGKDLDDQLIPRSTRVLDK
ncbi:MAG: serine protease [Micropepsaceae bacterium]